MRSCFLDSQIITFADGAFMHEDRFSYDFSQWTIQILNTNLVTHIPYLQMVIILVTISKNRILFLTLFDWKISSTNINSLPLSI